jgi:hypothetical protein
MLTIFIFTIIEVNFVGTTTQTSPNGPNGLKIPFCIMYVCTDQNTNNTIRVW